MTAQGHKTATRWVLAVLSAAAVAIVFYAAIYTGLSVFGLAKTTVIFRGAPDLVLQAFSIGIACCVGAEVLLWVLRLPERK